MLMQCITKIQHVHAHMHVYAQHVYAQHVQAFIQDFLLGGGGGTFSELQISPAPYPKNSVLYLLMQFLTFSRKRTVEFSCNVNMTVFDLLAGNKPCFVTA